MRLTKTLTATLTALTFAIVSCEEKKAVPHDHDGDGKPDHGPGEHGKAAVPHDHDGDGIPDHGPGEHGKAAVPHDHDGDGKPDHGPGEHGKAAVPHDHDGDGKPDHGPDAHDTDDHADNDHGHDHAEKTAGPNGGKVITAVEPHAEFFVTADRKVRITFLTADNKPASVGTQSVNIVCGDRSAPTMLNPTKQADGMSLLSAGTLPKGNNFPTIVTFKATADAAPVRAKFTLNMSDCPSCDYKEYACTCDHGHSH